MPRGPPQNLDPRWTSGELREEAREREEARRRAQEQQAQQRAGRPAYSGAPAGAPAAERVTVHDLVSEAPVVAEAPAGDGGLQSLHWSESQLQSQSALFARAIASAPATQLSATAQQRWPHDRRQYLGKQRSAKRA